jgi:GT2 family glycosyltransferase
MNPEMLLSVIVPARNEADCIAQCLSSLVAQSGPGLELGKDWEILCVNDDSDDATGEIAAGIAGVTVLQAEELPEGWTGKNNAMWQGVQRARGAKLLFSDADTVHEEGSLRRALHEMEHSKAALLSYSPRQIVRGFWQRALMPLVFSELACEYSPARVSDPRTTTAAANGQYILVDRANYDEVGGHMAIAGEVLEDVALALRFKRHGLKVVFRYAPEQVRTQMYRTNSAMIEGWTKNLALLFPHPIWLASMRKLDLLLIVGIPVLIWFLPRLTLTMPWQMVVLGVMWIYILVRFYKRVLKSNFPVGDCLLAPIGVPLFVLLMWLSWSGLKLRKTVSWKGRDIDTSVMG